MTHNKRYLDGIMDMEYLHGHINYMLGRFGFAKAHIPLTAVPEELIIRLRDHYEAGGWEISFRDKSPNFVRMDVNYPS
jgi:hypothetical protein